MTIRAGRIEDAAAMAYIYNYYVRTSPVIFSDKELSADEMAEKLRRLGAGDRFPFLVAEEDGMFAGYAYLHLWQPDPVYGRTWELTIYLSDKACGKGCGSAMLNKLICKARDLGAHSLISCISEGNAPCERMCVNAGFTLNGRFQEVGYKFGRYYNDAVYQLIL